MSIPKYDEMYRAFLDCLADGQAQKSKEVKDIVAGVFDISAKGREEMLPSGKQPLFDNRIGWTRTYLKKAGLKNVSVSGVVVFSAKDAYLNLPKGLPVVTMDRLPDFLKRSSFHARSKTDPQEVLRAIRAVQVTDRAVIRRHEAGVKEMAKRGGR